MITNKTSPKELWSRQQISSRDVDYDWWDRKRTSIQAFSQMSQSCIFMVDVFKARYDFASDRFANSFGYNSAWIQSIQNHGDMLEDRIHPDDRKQIVEYQIEQGQIIYSLPLERRNDYQQIFQIRMLNAQQHYVNVVSRHQVVQTDRNGQAWMIMGMMELAPNQVPIEKVKRTLINKKTGRYSPRTLFLELFR